MGLILLVACAIINLCFAFGLVSEASKLGQRRIMFSPIAIWFLATILAGPLVVLAFWVIHFSNLNDSNQHRTSQASASPSVLESLYDDGLLVYGNTLSNDRIEELLEQK